VKVKNLYHVFVTVLYIVLTILFNFSTFTRIVSKPNTTLPIPGYNSPTPTAFINVTRNYYVYNQFLSQPTFILLFTYRYILSYLIPLLNPTQLAVIIRLLSQFFSFCGVFILVHDYLQRSFKNIESKYSGHITLVSFLGGLLYGLNPSYWIGDYGWLDMEFAFATLPWVIWSFNKVILDRKWKYSVMCVLLMVINIDEHFLWAGFPIILTLYSCFIFLVKSTKKGRIDLHPILSFLSAMALFVLLIFYKFIIKIHSFSPYSYALTKAGLDACWKQAIMLNMLRAMSHMFLPNIYIPPEQSMFNFLNSLMPITLVIPIITALALSLYRKNWIVLFYSILLVLSILPFYVRSPFKWIHYWIFFHTPVGPAFRTWRVPDAYIALSLSVLIAFSLYYIFRKLLRTRKHILIGFITAGVLFVFCVYSWPLLTGDVNGFLSPVKVPNEYFQVHDFLVNQTGDFRVIYFPEFTHSYGLYTNLKPFWSLKLGVIQEFLTFSSPKPTFRPVLHWSHFYKFTLSPFYYSLLKVGDIEALSHFLGHANVKYLIVHNDILALKKEVTNFIQLLNNSMNFKPVFHDNFIYVFENELARGGPYVPSQLILVDGGYRAVKKFYNSISSNLDVYSFIFVDQKIPVNLLKNSRIILTDKNGDQLMNDFIFTKILSKKPNRIIYPYNYVIEHNPRNKWSRASLLDPHQQVWHPYVNWKNYAWDFDYMKGLVFTINSNDSFTIPFKVKKDDDYILLIRYLASDKGGEIKVSMRDNEFYIETLGNYNGFFWRSIDLGSLKAGEYKITIQNVCGFNAINVLVLISENEYHEAQKEIEKLIREKAVIHLFKAESDLYRSNAKIIKNINTSNSGLLAFSENGRAWHDIEVVKSGAYRLSLKGVGEFKVRVGDHKFILKSNSLNFTYTPLFHLSEGRYKLEILASKGSYLDVIWLYSTETNQTIDQLFEVKEEPAEIINYAKIDPTLWKIKVQAKKPFMLSFAESYDPLWEARVYENGKLVEKVRSIPLYGVINGFWINETGNLTIVIRYVPQDWFELGLKISGATFIACIFYLVWDWRTSRGDRWALLLEKSVKRIFSHGNYK